MCKHKSQTNVKWFVHPQKPRCSEFKIIPKIKRMLQGRYHRRLDKVLEAIHTSIKSAILPKKSRKPKSLTFINYGAIIKRRGSMVEVTS